MSFFELIPNNGYNQQVVDNVFKIYGTMPPNPNDVVRPIWNPNINYGHTKQYSEIISGYGVISNIEHVYESPVLLQNEWYGSVGVQADLNYMMRADVYGLLSQVFEIEEEGVLKGNWLMDGF